MLTLDTLSKGKSARIQSVGGEGALRRRLLDMGLTPGTKVTLHKVAPMGDPLELELRGYSLTLRKEDAAKIALSEEAGETDAR
ncbi:ferrous iron transport protein A [Ruminococcaceae bacterium OttesenSCG-928-I18]|nr:ferrous iron transport protein A [Ruminococcaceae bacterium OttesenSCG-928-I18]